MKMFIQPRSGEVIIDHACLILKAKRVALGRECENVEMPT